MQGIILYSLFTLPLEPGSSTTQVTKMEMDCDNGNSLCETQFQNLLNWRSIQKCDTVKPTFFKKKIILFIDLYYPLKENEFG